MRPPPRTEPAPKRPAGKLAGKVALVTGGDSGIGRAVSVLFAREGADVVVAFLEEERDAAETARMVRHEGKRCFTIAGDLGDPAHCRQVVDRTLEEFGEWDRHEGEEFIHVLEGTIEVFVGKSEAQRLRAGDSCYFDASFPHAALTVSRSPAFILSVTSRPEDS